MRLVHHGEVPAWTANRLVSGDFLHFESLKRSRDVVLTDVVRGAFPGEVVEHVVRPPRWRNRAGYNGKCIQLLVHELGAARGTALGVSRRTGTSSEVFVGVLLVEGELALRALVSKSVCLRAPGDGDSCIVHPRPAVND